jgi:hypothetical protein
VRRRGSSFCYIYSQNSQSRPATTQPRRKQRKHLIALVAGCALSFAALAQTPAPAPAPSAAAASSCEAKAVGKNGKPLAGAAKAASIKKCEKDATAASGASSCESKAVDKNGKALAGAARKSFMKKCEASAM